MRYRQFALGACSALVLAMSGCSGAGGGLGSILGSVLGGAGSGQSNELTGYIAGVDTRSRQIGIQQQNGQTVYVSYDAQTQVVYQNQSYPVTALETGDQVTARLQATQGGGYYTDVVQVNQSVRNNGSGASNGVQTVQGTVRQVDQANGWFTVDASNGARVTVTLTGTLSRADLDRFRTLRSGDFVRLYGTYLSTTRVELRQFY